MPRPSPWARRAQRRCGCGRPQVEIARTQLETARASGALPHEITLPARWEGNSYLWEGWQLSERVDGQGRLAGWSQCFRSDGSLWSEGRYENGESTGLWTTYKPDGRMVRIEAHYENGELHGLRKTYHETTNKQKSVGNYERGKKSGLWLSYFEDGVTKHTEMHYVNGKLHGLWKFYFPHGVKESEFQYKDDVLHGPMKQYYEELRIWRVKQPGSMGRELGFGNSTSRTA